MCRKPTHPFFVAPPPSCSSTIGIVADAGGESLNLGSEFYEMMGFILLFSFLYQHCNEYRIDNNRNQYADDDRRPLVFSEEKEKPLREAE